MDEDSLKSLRARLDENLAWPCLYTFKFIVPAAQVDQVVALFSEGHTIHRRPSKNGKYIGLTLDMMMLGSADVVDLYRKASKITGILCL